MIEFIICVALALIYLYIFLLPLSPKSCSYGEYFKKLNKISELIRNSDVSIEIFIPEIPKSPIFSLNIADLIKEKNKVVIYCCDFPQEYKVLCDLFTIKKVYSNAYTDIFLDKKISFILIDREKYVYIDDDNVEIGDSFTKIKEFSDFIFCCKVNQNNL